MPTASTFVPDIFFLLTQNGYGSYGTTLFKGTKAVIPITPIPVGFRAFVSIVRTGGSGDEGTHNLSRTTIAYERPSAQLVCRSELPDDAEAVADELYLLLNFVDTFINGCWWRKCSPKGEIYDLGVDTKERARFVFNIESVKRLSPATS